MHTQVEIGTWNHNYIYSSLEDVRIQQEIDLMNAVMHDLKPYSALFSHYLEVESVENQDLLEALWKAARLIKQFNQPMGNLQALVLAETSVDSLNKEAANLQLKLQKLSVQLTKATNPFYLCLDRVSDAFLQQFLEPTEFQNMGFLVKVSRKFRPFQLPLDQENLLSSLSPVGLQSWQYLYDDLTSKIPVQLNNRAISVAEALGLLESSDRSIRKAAYQGLDDLYHNHRHSFARILTSQVRWRLTEQSQRSENQTMHFLDEPLQAGRLTAKTLQSMGTAVENYRPNLGPILSVMAAAFGRQRLDPWDLLAQAPLPDALEFSFEEAMQLVQNAYHDVHPEMGAFVRMMVDNRWIDVRQGSARRPSAFAFHYQNPMEPRVFGTFMGTMKSLRMLAHEVGHAYHFWCLRGEPEELQRYPLTLAETASIFGELALGRHLKEHPDDNVRKLSAWQDAQSVLTYLLNIPMRFDFEKTLYERGEEYLESEDLCQMMSDICMHWHGNEGLSEPLKYFWASKLHFNLAYFYNYPYTFGYLLAQVLLDEYLNQNEGFHERYTRFLRATGKYSCEDLIQKELGQNCEEISFWERGTKMAQERVDCFLDAFGRDSDS